MDALFSKGSCEFLIGNKASIIYKQTDSRKESTMLLCSRKYFLKCNAVCQLRKANNTSIYTRKKWSNYVPRKKDISYVNYLLKLVGAVLSDQQTTVCLPLLSQAVLSSSRMDSCVYNLHFWLAGALKLIALKQFFPIFY